MNIRVIAPPEEAADFLLWLDRHGDEVQILRCGQGSALCMRGKNDRMRYDIEVRLKGKGGARNG